MAGERLLIAFQSGWRNYIAHSLDWNFIQAWTETPAKSAIAVLSDGTPLPPGVAQKPIVLVLDDIHCHTPAQLEDLRRKVAAYDFTICPQRVCKLPSWLPHLAESDRQTMIWCPHTVPDAMPLAQTDGEPSGFLVAAKAQKPYPMLWSVQQCDLPRLTVHQHPGYKSIEGMAAAKAAWFPTLARHHVGVVGLGWGPGGYVLAKYLEYMYAGMLLIAERPSPIECEALGLEHGENCLLFDWPGEQDELIAAYRDAIRNFDAYRTIAEAGQRLALTRHTASRRLDYVQAVAEHYLEHGTLPSVENTIAMLAEEPRYEPRTEWTLRNQAIHDQP